MRKISFKNIKTKRIVVALLIIALVIAGFFSYRALKNKNKSN